MPLFNPATLLPPVGVPMVPWENDTVYHVPVPGRPPEQLGVITTYVPHMLLQCPSCLVQLTGLNALANHMYGQGPNKNGSTVNCKSACPHFITEFAFFHRLGVADNKVFVIDAPNNVHGRQYVGAPIPSTVRDEMAYRKHAARVLLVECNLNDHNRSSWTMRPPHNVPARLMIRFVLTEPTVELKDILAVEHRWYVEDWRNSVIEDPDHKKVFMDALRERVLFERSVARHAAVPPGSQLPRGWMEVPDAVLVANGLQMGGNADQPGPPDDENQPGADGDNADDADGGAPGDDDDDADDEDNADEGAPGDDDDDDNASAGLDNNAAFDEEDEQQLGSATPPRAKASFHRDLLDHEESESPIPNGRDPLPTFTNNNNAAAAASNRNKRTLPSSTSTGKGKRTKKPNMKYTEEWL